MQGLPESDGTTSTNYGPSFEVSSTALYTLRSISNGKKFKTWMNYKEKPFNEEQRYGSWDDIVSEEETGSTLCVQLKHTKGLDTDKLDRYLAERETIVEKNPWMKIIFVFFATTPDDAIKEKYEKLRSNAPDFLLSLLTNSESVYFDSKNPNWQTYFCMNQKDVTKESEIIKNALYDCIGRNYIGNDHLKYVQTKFLDYIRQRYFRLLKGTDPLTYVEVSRELGYLIANKFKVEYKPGPKPQYLFNMLREFFYRFIPAPNVVILNHADNSALREHIWHHLAYFMNKQLKQDIIDDLWRKKALHMPVVSCSRDEDRTIMRALELADFQMKLLVLRLRKFTIRPKQKIVTLIQNLPSSAEEVVIVETDSIREDFRYVTIDFPILMENKTVELHPDSFCCLFKAYFAGKHIELPDSLIEGQDVCGFLNNDAIPALFLAIKVDGIKADLIEYLIELGVDVNASIVGGHRPISYAVQVNRPDILELLLKKDADPDPADKYGMRPLFYACNENKVKMVELLVRYGADRNASDVNGTRPLFMAYANKNFEIMRVLLKDFDTPQKANPAGNHILHVAAKEGCVECLECIVECCPNVRVFMTGDVNGKTPLDLANENDYKEFAMVLERALEDCR